jgi:hypothetical protein
VPRKQSVLPQPCPRCGRTDGTYQYVIFNHKYNSSRRAVICRIGHYDANRYLSLQIGKESSTINRQIKKPYGKIWHSFKVRPILLIPRRKSYVNVSRYFDKFKRGKNKRKTSLTIKPQPWMPEFIKKKGWQIIPEERLYYKKRQKVKDYPFPILTEKEKKWFAKRRKYRMIPPS